MHRIIHQAIHGTVIEFIVPYFVLSHVSHCEGQQYMLLLFGMSLRFVEPGGKAVFNRENPTVGLQGPGKQML